jgi:hypothetical protein
VISNVAFFALVSQRDTEMGKDFSTKIIEMLNMIIINNPASHRPLFDNHSIDIFLGLWAFYKAGRYDYAKSWLVEIFENLSIRKSIKGNLPILNSDIFPLIEMEGLGDTPDSYLDTSSTLIYQLFEFCLLFNIEDVYLHYQPIFSSIELQIWYPPIDVEKNLYHQEITAGSTEVSIKLPNNFTEFFNDVKLRHQRDNIKLLATKKGFEVIIFLACKYHRTPIFSYFWRNEIFDR